MLQFNFNIAYAPGQKNTRRFPVLSIELKKITQKVKKKRDDITFREPPRPLTLNIPTKLLSISIAKPVTLRQNRLGQVSCKFNPSTPSRGNHQRALVPIERASHLAEVIDKAARNISS